METISTLINNLKTQFSENASDEALLKIANAIVFELEKKTGKANTKTDFSIPTLAYQERVSFIQEKKVKIKKEEQEERSLNDILKEEKIEVSHVLESAPVQDLRKAIGINDRFVFISELFEGNESLYEQSVKTLNQISNLQEAENWIEKELKLRLHWNDEVESSQQFYKLVRRRYS